MRGAQKVLVRAATLLLWLCFLYGLAASRELFPGQYAQIDPQTQHWFRSQKVPGTERSCCTEADGVYAEEDIIQGHYWTRWRIHEGLTAWQPVPDEAVIRDPNRHGAPVVWWGENAGQKLVIRCYAPGGGV